MCPNVFEFILRSYVQFAGSEYLSLTLTYAGEDMTADLSAALRFKQTAENVAIDLSAEAVIAAGGSNYFIRINIVDDRAYVYFSLVGFEESNSYPDKISSDAVPLRAQFAVSSLFSMSSEAMPLIVSLLGLNKDELYYFNFVVELLGGTYETINSDILGVKDAQEWADLLLGIIDEYAGKAQPDAARASSVSVSLDGAGGSLSVQGAGLKASLVTGSDFEITAPAVGEYTDYSPLAKLMEVMMGSITQTSSVEDAEGNAVQSAQINRYYYLSGSMTGAIGSLDLTTIGVAASVYLHEDHTVTVNLRLDISYFIAVFKGDTVLEMTIEDGMVYMVRTQTSEAGILGIERQLDAPIVLYRAMPLDNFFGGILGQLGFLFNFSDAINDQIVGGGSGSTYDGSVTDIGSILTSFSYAEGDAAKWTFGLDLSSVTDGVLSDASLSLNAGADGILQGLDFSASLSVLTLRAELVYTNPGASMESGHEQDITENVAGRVSSLFAGALGNVDWAKTDHLEGGTATLTFVVDGQTLGTQTVAYDPSTGALLSAVHLPDLSSFNAGGYTYAWGEVGEIYGDTAVHALKTANCYTVTIESAHEIDGWQFVRIEDGMYIYELTYEYGTHLALPVGAECGEAYTLSAFVGEGGEFSAVDGILSDIRLTAVWEEIEYTVTYTVFGEVVARQTYGYGEAIVLPDDASAAGYVFESWDIAQENVFSDLTVEAIFSVTVTLGSDYAAEGFVQGEGSWFADYTAEGTAKEDFALGLCLSVPGYMQLGWWREAEDWQPVHSLEGLNGETIWAMWVSEFTAQVTSASKKDTGLWYAYKYDYKVQGSAAGGEACGQMSERIAQGIGFASQISVSGSVLYDGHSHALNAFLSGGALSAEAYLTSNAVYGNGYSYDFYYNKFNAYRLTVSVTFSSDVASFDPLSAVLEGSF